MNEYTLKKIQLVVAACLCGFFLWLVIDGQKTIGLAPLGEMLAGLAGIIFLLYLYNRRFTKPPRAGGDKP